MFINGSFKNIVDASLQSNGLELVLSAGNRFHNDHFQSVRELSNQIMSDAVSAGKQISEGNGNGLKLLSLKATEDLSKRPRKGKIYEAIRADVKGIETWLGNLLSCSPNPSIGGALEIADAISLLRLLNSSDRGTELVGEMAQEAAHLMQLATMVREKGMELLRESKSLLRKGTSGEQIEKTGLR